jgi:phage-related minor tail protein
VGFFTWLYNELVGHSIIPDLINGIVDWFKSLPDKISQGLSNLWSAIVEPFRKAFDEVKKMAEKVWEKLQKINPFHRE